MSDCNIGAVTRYSHEPVMRMRVVFEDGTDYPLTVLKMGREVAWFEVDGTRYLRVAEPDWDDLAVTD